jgi:hypothetical protein
MDNQKPDPMAKGKIVGQLMRIRQGKTVERAYAEGQQAAILRLTSKIDELRQLPVDQFSIALAAFVQSYTDEVVSVTTGTAADIEALTATIKLLTGDSPVFDPAASAKLGDMLSTLFTKIVKPDAKQDDCAVEEIPAAVG